MSAINLAPESWRRWRAQTRRLRTWAVALSVMWTLAGSGTAIVRLGMSGEDQEHSTRLADLHQAEAALQERIAEVNRLRTALSRQRALGEHPDWSVLFTAISRSAEDRVGVRRIEIETVGRAVPEGALGVVRITGVAWTQSDASAFVIALDELGVFGSVDLQSIVRERMQQAEGVAFTVVCSLREGS